MDPPWRHHSQVDLVAAGEAQVQYRWHHHRDQDGQHGEQVEHAAELGQRLADQHQQAHAERAKRVLPPTACRHIAVHTRQLIRQMAIRYLHVIVSVRVSIRVSYSC